MNAALSLVLLFLTISASADTTFSDGLMVLGQVGVGTTAPRARAHVQMHSADDYAVLVSSPDGSKILVLDKQGKLAIGVTTPAALVDVAGQADSNDIGLQLRVGNSSQTASSVQVSFAAPGDSSMRHSLRTRADASQDQYNRIEFYLWNAADSVDDLGDLNVLNIQKNSSASNGSVHVMPYGNPTAELVVSSATMLGGGTMIRADVLNHSSKKFKGDIRYLDENEEAAAYSDVRGLKPVRFRYGSGGELMTGLIYEESPKSIQGPGEGVNFNERLLNVEMAIKVARRKAERLRARIAELEGR